MAKKHLGQHFLTDPAILRRIADALPAPTGAPVLEVGPGRGALTRVLLERGLRVTAIERDRDLVPRLRADFPALRLVEADALEIDWRAALGGAPGEPWWVIGNIPYNITSPLIDHALAAPPPLPSAIVYLVQKEVALRLGAGPGTADYGALTVGVQAAARVERLFGVPAGAFRPPPRVDSAVIRLTPRPEADADPVRRAAFRRLVVGLFGARRKQLVRAVRTALDLEPEPVEALVSRTGLDPTQRPETLSVVEFQQLFQAVIDAGLAARLGL